MKISSNSLSINQLLLRKSGIKNLQKFSRSLAMQFTGLDTMVRKNSLNILWKSLEFHHSWNFTKIKILFIHALQDFSLNCLSGLSKTRIKELQIQNKKASEEFHRSTRLLTLKSLIHIGNQDKTEMIKVIVRYIFAMRFMIWNWDKNF